MSKRIALEPGRTLLRATQFYDHGRQLLIELHPRMIVLRFKGTHERWSVTYEGIYWHALRRDAEQTRLERAKKGKR